ncbi:MAG: ADOP family duplicated permease [Gemmatimonadaceae bacterium]
MLKAIRMRLRALFHGAGVDADTDEEVRFHLEQQIQLYLRDGMTREAATRRARLAFGSLDWPREARADGRFIEHTLGDIRYALRSLWRDRGLSVAGVLTLTLGIGATTAVFSAVNAVMLRELPFRDSGRLVAAWEQNPDRNWYKNVVAPANYLDWRDRVKSFEGLAAYTDYLTTATMTGRGEPRLFGSSNISGDALSVLGVTPHLGRGFDREDDWANGQRKVLISYKVWQSEFAGDPDIVGKSVMFGGTTTRQIVGVMPRDFAFPTPATDLWLPMEWGRDFPSRVFFRRAHWLRTVGRLKPGVSIEQANAELQTVAKQLESEYPATNVKMGAGLTPIREWIVGDTKKPLVVLLSAAAVLLLIACGNVGNLLLVHAVGRSRDVSLRFALGATRGRVARQALTESLVLSAIGGAAGFALGWAGARGLLALQPEGMLPVTDIGVDYRVWAFTILLTTVSGVMFGMAPAIIATRQAPADALNRGGRTFSSGRTRRWGRYLVVAEVGLAVMLTVGAGLLLRSYDRLSKVAPGFDPEGVLTTTLSLSAARYDSAHKVVRFYDALLERIQALPGVERVAAVRQLPVTVASWSSSLAVKGRPPLGQTDILHREVVGDYFRTMRVPLIKGRTFTEADDADAPMVVVVNEAFVKEFLPNEDPVGRQITSDRIPDSTSVWRTIVGVVGSERQGNVAQPSRPEVFAPLVQDWTRGMTVVTRMQPGRDPMTLAQPVRRAVRDLDSLLAITAIRPMTEVHGRAMARERFVSVLVLVFAATGIALALVGVFGVLAQLVQARWRELGIRLALGAQRSEVSWLVVRHGATLLGLGIAGGLIAALGATQVLATLLYEVQPTDLLTYAGVTVFIGGAGMLAAWVPALRASMANPANTLRAE